jgi:hypothetical protein
MKSGTVLFMGENRLFVLADLETKTVLRENVRHWYWTPDTTADVSAACTERPTRFYTADREWYYEVNAYIAFPSNTDWKDAPINRGTVNRS